MRRFIAVNLWLCLTIAPAAAWIHGSATLAPTGGLLVNAGGVAYYTGFNSFLNWWNTGSANTLVSTINGTLSGKPIWDNGTYLNPSTGELIAPMPSDVTSFARGFFTAVQYPNYQYEGTSFNNFAGQVWDVSWQGCTPSVSTTGNLGTGGTSSFGANTGTITLGSSGYSNVGIKFTFTGIPSCYTNPPHNVIVSQHQYATNVANGEIFNPDWINDIKQFGIIRLMDWASTNSSSMTNISQMADANYNSWNHGGPSLAKGSSSTVSGNQLTIGSLDSGAFVPGTVIYCLGCTAGTTILSGGPTTYTLSNSFTQSTPEDIVGVIPVGTNTDFGPKGGVSPSLACALANKANINVEFPIPVAAPDSMVTAIASAFKSCLNPWLKVKYSYSNEDWNPGFLQYRYDFAQPGAITGYAYHGYRGAQVLEDVYNVYGAGGRSQWIGALGSQCGNTAISTDIISGANSWITGGATHTLTQLVDEIDVAPYFGPYIGGTSIGDSYTITNVTAGATPTVTTSGNVDYTNGQSVKLFVNGGTMASVLNNVYAIVSSVSGNTFQINIATTGLTYGGSNNIVMDSTLFKLADQSATLNGSTPATYPTKFSYFTQQLSQAILNGTASDASYGTINITAQIAQLLTGGTGSLQNLLQQHALIANENGLKLSEYEGGNTIQGVGPFASNPPNQLAEYLINYNFDNGVAGDSTDNISNLYATVFQALRSVNSAYSAQYTDQSPQSATIPWGSVRFLPGDESNPKWQALVTESARGVYVDPTPPATGTYSYPGHSTNYAFFSGSCSSCTDSYSPVVGTAATKLIVAYTTTGGTPGTLTCDGVTMTLDAHVLNGRTANIYSGSLGTGSNTRTCNMVYSGTSVSSQWREFYAITASGLTSSSALTNSASVQLSETKGSLIVAVVTCGGNFNGSSGVSQGTTTSIATDTPSSGTSGMEMLSANFTSPIFNIQNSCVGGPPASATYR